MRPHTGSVVNSIHFFFRCRKTHTQPYYVDKLRAEKLVDARIQLPCLFASWYSLSLHDHILFSQYSCLCIKWISYVNESGLRDEEGYFL